MHGSCGWDEGVIGSPSSALAAAFRPTRRDAPAYLGLRLLTEAAKYPDYRYIRPAASSWTLGKIALGGYMASWRVRLSLVVVASSLFLSACGSSGPANGTSYWRADFQGGTTLYMSVNRSGENVSGYAKYGDGSFGHYVGTVNSDGSFTIGAFGGATAKIDGSKMSVTFGEGTNDYVSASEAEYKSAGPTE
jgi:hypothetical protein